MHLSLPMHRRAGVLAVLLAASWDDAAIVTARVVDARGVTVPSAANPIQFRLGGKAILAGVDNGSITSHEPYQGNRCVAAEGRCVALVKAAAGGQITVTASAQGLSSRTLTLNTVSTGVQQQ